jgi:hypothetical protein
MPEGVIDPALAGNADPVEQWAQNPLAYVSRSQRRASPRGEQRTLVPFLLFEVRSDQAG